MKKSWLAWGLGLWMLLGLCAAAAESGSALAAPFCREYGYGYGDGIDLTKEELNQPGRRIGVPTGSAAMIIAEKEFPHARIEYFNDPPSAYEAVAQGKLDAFIFDREQMRLAIESGLRGVHLLEETMDEGVSIAVGLSPVSAIPDLPARINAFLEELRQSGGLEDMRRRWVLERREDLPEIPPAEHPQLRLTVGTTGSAPPYTYYAGTQLTGYDIELARRFAAWLGAELEFKIYDYAGIVAAAAAGDVDCVMANLNITKERSEVLPFSDVLYVEELGILVRGDTEAAAEAGGQGFWAGLADSFGKTFLREERWKLIVRGVLTTLAITVLSVLFGTLLGFAVFLLCRSGNPAANAVTRFCTGLVRGMPMVVLLMILYYIVFAGVAVSGIWVAVIGFTLTFGSSVLGLLKLGTGAVDPGQYEAAGALGYSGRATFFRIILPQALPHVMPAWRGEIVGLIKSTAVVGYIAVQDLTKMGDIIRSRTYEAFFPLIAVTVIYFLLETLFGLAVRRITLRLDPKRRTPEKILKGVKTHDPC